jgi:vacuolar-type H+-ATPase subunit E/Vma4
MSEVQLANASIYEKIENKGIEDAKKILAAGAQKAREAENAILDEAKKRIALSLDKCVERNRSLLKTRTTEFEQAAKQITLARKKALIDGVFASALVSLGTVSPQNWERLVVRLLKTDELTGNELILASRRDHEMFRSVFASSAQDSWPLRLDLLNKALKGKKYELALAKEIASCDGGFFVKGTDFDVDHSYATMLSDLKNRFESEIAALLFDGRG